MAARANQQGDEMRLIFKLVETAMMLVVLPFMFLMMQLKLILSFILFVGIHILEIWSASN